MLIVLNLDLVYVWFWYFSDMRTSFLAIFLIKFCNKIWIFSTWTSAPVYEIYGNSETAYNSISVFVQENVCFVHVLLILDKRKQRLRQISTCCFSWRVEKGKTACTRKEKNNFLLKRLWEKGKEMIQLGQK